MPEIIRSAEYEAPALEWLYSQIERLREALAAAGVDDEGVQRAVCETFFFGLATDFDDAEVLPAPRARRRLAFEQDGAMLFPDDESFAFHEYALGVVGEAFGDA